MVYLTVCTIDFNNYKTSVWSVNKTREGAAEFIKGWLTQDAVAHNYVCDVLTDDPGFLAGLAPYEMVDKINSVFSGYLSVDITAQEVNP